jgi:hypothetical protein
VPPAAVPESAMDAAAVVTVAVAGFEIVTLSNAGAETVFGLPYRDWMLAISLGESTAPKR